MSAYLTVPFPGKNCSGPDPDVVTGIVPVQRGDKVLSVVAIAGPFLADFTAAFAQEAPENQQLVQKNTDLTGHTLLALMERAPVEA